MRWLSVAALIGAATVAYGQQCRDAWVTQAIQEVTCRPPQGSGNSGECDIMRYGRGQWSSYADLKGKVQAAFGTYTCRDACVSRAIIETTGRGPNGRGDQGECDYRQYANGSWSSYDQLKSAVQAKFAPAASYGGRTIAIPSPAPARPGTAFGGQRSMAQTAPAPPAASGPARVQVPDSYVLYSKMGGKCVGVENGQPRAGSRLILWDCNGKDDQSFTFTSDGQIHAFGGKSNLCVTAYGGQGRAGDGIQVHPCQAWSNQKWRYENGLIRGMNNRCMDIRGGVYAGNRDAILWDCSGADNQRFAWGKVVPQSALAVAAAAPGGLMSQASQRPVTFTDSAGHVITFGGGNVITMGGGNVITMGGGNVIAIGGGNVIAFGGGNVIAMGGGN